MAKTQASNSSATILHYITTCRDKIRPAVIPFFEVIKDVEPEKDIAVNREAIVNAFIHRDYRLSGSDIELTIYEDRSTLRFVMF